MNLEILKVIISTITPFLVFIFGLIFLRKSENIKSEVSRSSGFSQKWADEFFQSYKSYLNNIEDITTLLFHLQRDNTDSIIKNLNSLFVDFSKHQFHIDLWLSTFPKITECNKIKYSMKEILSLLNKIKETRKVNCDDLKFDDLKTEISKFNILIKKVHSEFLKS